VGLAKIESVRLRAEVTALLSFDLPHHALAFRKSRAKVSTPLFAMRWRAIIEEIGYGVSGAEISSSENSRRTRFSGDFPALRCFIH
jgi:hypothetical protein